jgi:type II secretory pathway pseudopilin PulG
VELTAQTMQPGNRYLICDPRRLQEGYLLIVLMFAIAIFGVGLSVVGRWESEIVQRQREAELLRSGAEVVAAIREYRQMTPGTANMLPMNWNDLIEDRRFLGLVRHLRRTPLDPFSNRADWAVIRDTQGFMVGISSNSRLTPLLQIEVTFAGLRLPQASHYSDWKFAFDPALDMGHTAP